METSHSTCQDVQDTTAVGRVMLTVWDSNGQILEHYVERV
jgi:hypothetical protein